MATLVTSPERMTFIHIPKNAGNSITNWLLEHTEAAVTKRNQHADIHDVHLGDHVLGPVKYKSMGWKFCVVRNPYDWCVSWYTFKLRMCNDYIELLTANPEMQRRSKEKFKIEGHIARKERLENLGFSGWIQEFHRSEQHKWAKDCDYVMRMETLQEDFKVVQEKVGCFEPLGVFNKTSDRKSYREYYNDYAIEVVSQKFKTDIETYGYTF